MNRATQHSTAPGRAASRRAALVLCGLALALGLSPAVSGARSAGPSFGLNPQGVTGSQRYFVLHARPGQILTRRIEVVNVGHRTGSVLLYAVDATTGQTTGAVYQGAEVTRRGVGAWTSLGGRELRLAAGRSELVRVRVRVPRSAAPGTHLGGIVAENKTLGGGRPVRRGRGSFRIRIRDLTVSAVQVEVPGPRMAQMALTGVVRAGGSPGGHQTVLVGLRNTGNTLLKPTLSVILRDNSGRVLQQTRAKLDTFVPRTEILYPVPVLHRGLRPGHYTAELAVGNGRGQLVRARTPFEISSKQVKQVFGASSPLAQSGGGSSVGKCIPWALIVALAGVAGVLYRRQRRSSRPGASDTAG